MAYLFFFLLLLSIVALIVGLIKPQKLHLSSRKKAGAIFGALSLTFLILIGISAEPVEKLSTSLNEEVTIIEEAPKDEVVGDVLIEKPIEQKTALVTTSSPSPKTTPSQSPAPSSTGYNVSSVVDGDTVKVTIDGKVETIRIIGLNTPETVDPRKPVECFGREASNKAKELLSGKTVMLEMDSTQGDRDKYGRLLRYVILPDGRDFGKTMIAEGYAYEYTYNTPYKYQQSYKTAQTAAQSGQLGLWSPNTCNGSADTGTVQTTSSTASGTYYTSSHYTSKYYYPTQCEVWKGLSATYLKSFNSLEDLLKTYPSRTLSPQCE